MCLFQQTCPNCNSLKCSNYSTYKTKYDGLCHLFKCDGCDYIFSETANTLLFNLKLE